jgi:hypothetical protein
MVTREGSRTASSDQQLKLTPVEALAIAPAELGTLVDPALQQREGLSVERDRMRSVALAVRNARTRQRLLRAERKRLGDPKFP